MKEIEQSIFIEPTDDEPFGCEVILYKDGTSKRVLYSEDGKLVFYIII